MRLDEKSVVSYWRMDENFQIWPEFDTHNPNDPCQFLDTDDFSRVKEELKSLVAKGKFPSNVEAFNAYKNGSVKIKIPNTGNEQSTVEKVDAPSKIDEPSISKPVPKEPKEKPVKKVAPRKSQGTERKKESKASGKKEK